MFWDYSIHIHELIFVLMKETDNYTGGQKFGILTLISLSYKKYIKN